MINKTLTYSDKVKGWTSFFSFIPEKMIGMNNKFYTFKGGNLYRHNTNPIRNNFYGVQYNSELVTIINTEPSEEKLFKTIQLEGTEGWDMLLQTDVQLSGHIDKEWFEKKEGSWYSFIRNSGTIPASSTEYVLRSANGIGMSESFNIDGDETTINFALTVDIGSIISIGDVVYFTQSGDTPSWGEPKLGGVVTEIVSDIKNGNNNIVMDTSDASTIAMTDNVSFILFVKNAVAESHGVLGHYCKVTMTNSSTEGLELFAVESEVMKSFP